MSDLTMGIIETRFAEMIWQREPVTTGELTQLCSQELGCTLWPGRTRPGAQSRHVQKTAFWQLQLYFA